MLNSCASKTQSLTATDMSEQFEKGMTYFEKENWLKEDPDFFNKIKREKLRTMIQEKREKESSLRKEEKRELEHFLDDEFANLD